VHSGYTRTLTPGNLLIAITPTKLTIIPKIMRTLWYHLKSLPMPLTVKGIVEVEIHGIAVTKAPPERPLVKIIRAIEIIAIQAAMVVESFHLDFNAIQMQGSEPDSKPRHWDCTYGGDEVNIGNPVKNGTMLSVM